MAFEVNGRLILEEPIDVMRALQSELSAKGIRLLGRMSESGSDIMFCCPYHGNGAERNPSCGIAVRGPSAGVFHCFACGAAGTLPQLVSHCFGFEDGGAYGASWLLKRFVTHQGEDGRRLPPLGDLGGGDGCIIDMEGGREFQPYHPYMDKRGLSPAVREKFHVGYDPDTDCLTFPVWDARGNYVCTTRRSCSGKAFYIPKGIEKPVYGLNFVTGDSAFVCESAINCLTLWGWGYEAVALFGLGTPRQWDELARSGIRKFALCFDGDKAGRRGRDKFIENVRHKVLVWVEFPPGRDANDLTKGEFEALPRAYV